jgi:hypothetical protein
MPPNPNEAPTTNPLQHDGPVILMGTIDGAGDRLADLLGCHPRLSRVPRSHLLVDLAVAIERNRPALVGYGMPEQYWLRAAGSFFDGVQRAYAARDRKARWVTYVSPASLPLRHLDGLFPTAQFVHVVTRPRGGAGRITSATRQTGAGLLPGRYLEVIENEMVTDAEECALRVLSFLGEEGAAGDVLVGEEVVVDLVDRRLHPTEPR